QAVQEPVNAVEAEGLVRFHRLPRVSGYTRVESEKDGFRQPVQDERKIRNRKDALLILFGIPGRPSRFFYCVTNSDANEGMHKGCARSGRTHLSLPPFFPDQAGGPAPVL